MCILPFIPEIIEGAGILATALEGTGVVEGTITAATAARTAVVGATAVKVAYSEARVVSTASGSASSGVYRGSTLARNMANAGNPVAKGTQQAHHLAAQNASTAAPARGVLQRAGIGIHDAQNGAAVNNATHAGAHTALHRRSRELLRRYRYSSCGRKTHSALGCNGTDPNYGEAIERYPERDASSGQSHRRGGGQDSWTRSLVLASLCGNAMPISCAAAGGTSVSPLPVSLLPAKADQALRRECQSWIGASQRMVSDQQDHAQKQKYRLDDHRDRRGVRLWPDLVLFGRRLRQTACSCSDARCI